MNDIITKIIIKVEQQKLYWIFPHSFHKCTKWHSDTQKAPFISHRNSHQQNMFYAESEFLV